MGTTLYLECRSGISGDMAVGALLDLGARRDVLEKILGRLPVGGYRLHFGRTVKLMLMTLMYTWIRNIRITMDMSTGIEICVIFMRL